MSSNLIPSPDGPSNYANAIIHSFDSPLYDGVGCDEWFYGRERDQNLVFFSDAVLWGIVNLTCRC